MADNSSFCYYMHCYVYRRKFKLENSNYCISTSRGCTNFLNFFLGFYFFIIISALPINMYISKKIQNKLIAFILFNAVGFILVRYTIGIWIFSSVDYISIYLIFPLFSILSLVRPFHYNTDYIEKG